MKTKRLVTLAIIAVFAMSQQISAQSAENRMGYLYEVFGIIGGVCTLNLVVHALKFDAVFFIYRRVAASELK